MATRYEYLGGAAWHFDDDDGLTKENGQRPNYEFTYRVAEGQITAVTTETLTSGGGQRVAKIELLDGWLRPRQTQAPGPGGRLMGDTFYDERGQVVKSYAPYSAAGDPETALFGVGAPGNVETQTRTEYDGLGRKTVEKLTKGNGSQPEQELWRTTYSYGGANRVSIIPPAGGTPTTEINNARGQVIERRQHKASTSTGDFDATAYTYTPSGEIAAQPPERSREVRPATARETGVLLGLQQRPDLQFRNARPARLPGHHRHGSSRGDASDIINAIAYAVKGDWKNAGISTVALLPVVGQAAAGARLAPKVPTGCVSSFVPGTPVLLADGTSKAIEDLHVGDEVLATDPETGEATAEPVLDTITSKGDKNLVQITINAGAPALGWTEADTPGPATATPLSRSRRAACSSPLTPTPSGLVATSTPGSRPSTSSPACGSAPAPAPTFRSPPPNTRPPITNASTTSPSPTSTRTMWWRVPPRRYSFTIEPAIFRKGRGRVPYGRSNAPRTRSPVSLLR
nr:hypothetical protein [Actinomadura sp. NAK00032]